jgi:hypothetical protein
MSLGQLKWQKDWQKKKKTQIEEIVHLNLHTSGLYFRGIVYQT